MNRLAKVGLWIAGTVVAVVFLNEMLGQYGRRGGGGPYAADFAHPSTLPGDLAGSTHKPLLDSLSVDLRPDTASFDSSYVVDATVTNRSGTAIGAIVLRCDALGGNGDVAGSTAVSLPHDVAAHSSWAERRVPVRFVHKPASARCVVADYTTR